jgi:hypothetical protein
MGTMLLALVTRAALGVAARSNLDRLEFDVASR